MFFMCSTGNNSYSVMADTWWPAIGPSLNFSSKTDIIRGSIEASSFSQILSLTNLDGFFIQCFSLKPRLLGKG